MKEFKTKLNVRRGMWGGGGETIAICVINSKVNINGELREGISVKMMRKMLLAPFATRFPRFATITSKEIILYNPAAVSFRSVRQF